VKILIYWDLSTNLDNWIPKGWFKKLMQILFGDNLLDIFK